MFPMLRTTLLLLAAVLLMLCISSCEPDTVPFLTYCSIQGDGTLFDKDDNSLAVGSWGRAFYLSDDTVFYLGSSLVDESDYNQISILLRLSWQSPTNAIWQ